MSLDLHVWSVLPFDQPHTLPKPDQWQARGTGRAFEGKKWQIVLGPSQEVEADDIPPEVSPRLVSIRYLTELNLEPGHAPSSAAQLLRRTALAVAKATRGLVHDPQEDTITLGSGESKPPASAASENVSCVRLCWWFTDGPLQTRDGIATLLGWLRRNLPDFLPRRYGGYEPLPHRFDGNSEGHFLDFMVSDDFVKIWEPAGRMLSVFLKNDATWGYVQRGPGRLFQVNRFELRCPADLLADAGWGTALRRCWEFCSMLIRPFYGDVRTLDGYIRRGNRLTSNSETTEHPVASVNWRGIPSTLGRAVVLGTPYLDLWPEFAMCAEHRDGLAFVSAEDWTDATDLSATIPPPSALCQPEQARFIEELHRMPDGSTAKTWRFHIPTRIAEIWPFPR